MFLFKIIPVFYISLRMCVNIRQSEMPPAMLLRYSLDVGFEQGAWLDISAFRCQAPVSSGDFKLRPTCGSRHGLDSGTALNLQQ